MRKPLVTVVTPSFNQGKYLEESILSVKNQSYDKIEHIIIDSCSHDNTKEILKTYAGTYNVKIVVEPDDGPADALNKGFALSKGDILCWLNSDDYYLHNHVVEDVVSYFGKYKMADAVSGCGYKVDNDGKLLNPIVKYSMISYEKLKYTDCILQPSTFWRRWVHVKLETDLNYTFDWKFFLDVFSKGASILSVCDYFSAYRIHDHSKTYCDNAQRKAEVAKMLKNNFGLLSLQHIWAQYIYILYKPFSSRI